MYRLSRAQRCILAAALALCLPVFVTGLYNDDHVHRAALAGSVRGLSRSPLRLYEFTGSEADTLALRDDGLIPWWSSPSLRMRFARPLSSALVALGHRVGGASTVFSHAHALLWFAALTYLAARLFTKLLPPRAAAWATASYALAEHQLSGTLWAAGLNGLVSGTLGLGAFALFVRARGPDRACSLALLALALLAGETALGAVALCVAWELLARPAPWRARAKALAPVLALALAYLALYSALGYGVRGSGTYLDPMRRPGPFLARLPVGLLVLAVDAVLQVPSEFSVFAPRAAPVIAALGACVLAALLALLWRARVGHARAVTALLVGALLAAVPGTAAMWGGRVLPLAGVGFAALVGSALEVLWERRARALAWVPGGALVLAMALLGPALRVVQPVGIHRATEAQAHLLAPGAWRCGPEGDAIVLVSSDPSVGMYVRAALASGGVRARSVRLLSMVDAVHGLRRTGPDSFELELLGGARFLRAPLELLYRDPSEPLRVGERVALRGLTVTVLAGASGEPTRLRVETEQALEEPAYCVLEWREGALRRATFAPAGEQRVLRHEPGPLGM